VGPRGVLDVVVKRKIPGLCRESNPRTPIVQLVAMTKVAKVNRELFPFDKRGGSAKTSSNLNS
jgi:hypothetical protein